MDESVGPGPDRSDVLTDRSVNGSDRPVFEMSGWKKGYMYVDRHMK